MGGAGEVGEPVLCCSWPGAPSPREILTLWKTEQAVGRGGGVGRGRGGGPRAQGEGGLGARLINQSHQLSGLTKTRDPGSLGGWGQGAGSKPSAGVDGGGGKAEMRGSILLRGPCLKTPQTTGVCAGGGVV